MSADFTLYQGDSKTITVTVTDGSGNKIDLTGASVTWALGQGSAVLVSKSTADGGITLATDPTTGQFSIALKATDTSSLAGQYNHFARVKLADGETAIVVTGSVTVNKSLI